MLLDRAAGVLEGAGNYQPASHPAPEADDSPWQSQSLESTMSAGARPRQRRQSPLRKRDVKGPPPGGIKILRLPSKLYLMWATPSYEDVAFEVSKVVDQPLQSRCATAPLCPDEALAARESRGEAADLEDVPVDPKADPDPNCPYEFESKAECIRERNIEALRNALFAEEEVSLIANYLRALGYEVRNEEIPLESLNGSRVLMAHSRIYSFHDVRVLCAPGGRELVLLRNPY